MAAERPAIATLERQLAALYVAINQERDSALRNFMEWIFGCIRKATDSGYTEISFTPAGVRSGGSPLSLYETSSINSSSDGKYIMVQPSLVQQLSTKLKNEGFGIEVDWYNADPVYPTRLSIRW